MAIPKTRVEIREEDLPFLEDLAAATGLTITAANSLLIRRYSSHFAKWFRSVPSELPQDHHDMVVPLPQDHHTMATLDQDLPPIEL